MIVGRRDRTRFESRVMPRIYRQIGYSQDWNFESRWMSRSEGASKQEEVTYPSFPTPARSDNMSAPISLSSLLGVIRTCVRPAVRKSRPQSRLQQSAFSTTRPTSYESDVDRAERPRWQQTPRGMAMPVRTRRALQQAPFLVNEDPAVLDEAYRKMLGHDGDQMLPEELKWLAVTHKSFDHARRGFNDRLAFLGMDTRHWKRVEARC